MKADAVTLYRRGVAKWVRAELYRRLALIACALERHWLMSRTFPTTLASLVPRYLSRVPLDLMSGNSLKYQRVEDVCFRLYSVGLDRQDDHGQPEPKTSTDNLAAMNPPESLTGIDWIRPVRADRNP